MLIYIVIGCYVREKDNYFNLTGNLTHSKIPRNFISEHKLNIGIVGFGNFGQFLSKTFVRQGHIVSATSRTDYSTIAASMGVRYFSQIETFCDESFDVIILSMSILSFESVLEKLPFLTSKLNECLVVDVLSVKTLPKKILLEKLPNSCDIVCTHPMFGPEVSFSLILSQI